MFDNKGLTFSIFGSRTTSRRDFKPKGLQAKIKTLQAPQNTILSSLKRYFSKVLASLVYNKTLFMTMHHL